jgi:GT2 family glycosyltransferase
MANVVAVILTHNRRTGALRRCREVLGQTRPPDVVILVDNASRDGTAAAVAEQFPQVRVHRLPENLGPAGGFATAFTLAVAEGCDFVWALDDDVVVSPTCLEGLLQDAAVMPDTVIFPVRLPAEEKHGVAWRGMLVPARVIRAVGVPRADLFWHLEDTEYFLYRIQDRGGFRIAISTRATAWHGTHRPRRGFPGWKLYYQTRNSVYYRFHLRQDPWRRVRLLALVAARILVIALREEQGLAKARLMVRGVWDGLRGRLGKTVDPEREPPSRLSRPGDEEDGEQEEAARQAALARWERDRAFREHFLRLWGVGVEERRGA